MDLTHLGYVHTTTIGGNPSQHVEAKMQTEHTPLGLKFTPLDAELRATADLREKRRGFQGPDRPFANAFEFVAPGLDPAMERGAAETGAYSEGDTSGSPLEFRLFHGLTPGERHLLLLLLVGSERFFRQDEPAATEEFFRSGCRRVPGGQDRRRGSTAPPDGAGRGRVG